MKTFRTFVPSCYPLGTELEPATEAGACPHLQAVLMYSLGERCSGAGEAPPGAASASDAPPGTLSPVVLEETGSHYSVSRSGKQDVFK